MKKIRFNNDWIFSKQGVAGKKSVTLPHDAMIHEQRSAGEPSGSACAFFPGGVYVYEKNWSLPADWNEGYAALEFEGVYRNTVVTVNGIQAGTRPYGYIPFTVRIDPYLKAGEDNLIVVTADNSQMPNSRYYTGSGIYRPVTLITGNKTHFAWRGVRISTISWNPAKIRVDMDIETEADAESGSLQAEIFILDPDQACVCTGTAEIGSGKYSASFDIPDARLWSDQTPDLYTCRAVLKNGEEVLDEVTETFGIRKVEWNPQGLFVNGKETLLRGGCLHHDSGLLGAATYDEAEDRRVRMLKEAGFNAIRSSHNPAAGALLKACDKYGMYVMDETWDMWYHLKTKHDYASSFTDWYRQDITDMVAHDFNHPSVIMYSIGNEVSEPAHEKGQILAKEMTDLFHSLDPNRAVSGGINLMILTRSAKGSDIYGDEGRDNQDKQKKMSGMNSTMFNMITMMVGTGMNKAANGKKADLITTPVLDTLDIAGYNYASGRYPLEGKAHPQRVIFGSETFPQDIWKNWSMVKKYPYLVGDFMWTAWDYLGEVGIGGWAYTPDGKGFEKPYPWISADAGALDLLGNPTGEIFLAQAAWGLLKDPVISVRPVNHPGVQPARSVWRGTNSIPSWSWQGCEGNQAVVEIYASEGSVALGLDGRKLGQKKIKNGKAIFKVKYRPGTLQVVHYNTAGEKDGQACLRSAKDALSIVLAPEKQTLTAGEIVFIPVTLEDAAHSVESNADRRLDITLENGELLAFGSANPRTEELYDSGSFTTYYGRALAVVRAVGEGTLTVRVTDGKQEAKAEIPVKDH